MKNRVYDNKRGLRRRLLRDLSATKRCGIDGQQFWDNIQSAKGYARQVREKMKQYVLRSAVILF